MFSSGACLRFRTWTRDQIARGRRSQSKVASATPLDLWRDDFALYSPYVATMTRLLDLTPDRFDPRKFKVSDLIPPLSLGPANSLWDWLQHYVTGVAPDGLALDSARPAGLGTQLSCDELSAGSCQNPQYGITRGRTSVRRPDRFTAMRVLLEGEEAVWLYRDEEHQALIQSRDGMVHYQPIARLTAREDGALSFDRLEWAPGFPLEIFARIPNWPFPQRSAANGSEPGILNVNGWRLSIRRVTQTASLVCTEELLGGSGPATPCLERKRRLRRTDLLVLASPHWNFNARAFNPGESRLLLPSVNTLCAAGRRRQSLRDLQRAARRDCLRQFEFRAHDPRADGARRARPAGPSH